MLPRTRRLRAAEVKEVTSHGKNLRGEFLSARARIGGDTIRAAVVVSKTLAKNAVKRNYLRRILYNSIVTTVPSRGASIVFFLRRIPPSSVVSQLRSDVQRLLLTLDL